MHLPFCGGCREALYLMTCVDSVVRRPGSIPAPLLEGTGRYKPELELLISKAKVTILDCLFIHSCIECCENLYHGLNSGLDLGLEVKKTDSVPVLGELGIIRIKGD